MNTIPNAKEDLRMSHFSVAVFSRTPGDVEALLAPFNEQVAPGDPYAVFVRDESGQLDEMQTEWGIN